MLPDKEVCRILLRAYPCRSFEHACSGLEWRPDSGHIPRGFAGATGIAADVEAVFVLSEPPQPRDRETYPSDTSALGYVDAVSRGNTRRLMAQNDQYHRNLRFILNAFFPGLGLEAQLKRCWITHTVLCSSSPGSGPIPVAAARECRHRYLDRQLSLFQAARIVALGESAQRRLKGYTAVLEGAHPGPPGCNHRGAREGWEAIARHFRGG